MNTIVVGYDASESADRALERAAGLAKAFSAKLVVTSVAPVLVGRGGPVDPVDRPEDHQEELRRARTILAERGLKAEYDVVVANPADHIVHLAQERGADLIVVGTHERNLVERLLGMSVSDTVERKAHCDVLVVH